MQIVLYNWFVKVTIAGLNGLRWYGCALGQSKWFKDEKQMEDLP